MKDLLLCIEVTAPVFHFEMSELKADFSNTTQTTAGRTQKVEGGGGEEFNK